MSSPLKVPAAHPCRDKATCHPSEGAGTNCDLITRTLRLQHSVQLPRNDKCPHDRWPSRAAPGIFLGSLLFLTAHMNARRAEVGAAELSMEQDLCVGYPTRRLLVFFKDRTQWASQCFRSAQSWVTPAMTPKGRCGTGCGKAVNGISNLRVTRMGQEPLGWDKRDKAKVEY